jgi:hypothetical protein
MVSSNTAVKWSDPEDCLCEPGFFAGNAGCHRCTPGFYCPGVSDDMYEHKKLPCPSERPFSALGARDNRECLQLSSKDHFLAVLNITAPADCFSFELSSKARIYDLKEQAQTDLRAHSVQLSTAYQRVRLSATGNVQENDDISVETLQNHLQSSEGFEGTRIVITSFTVDGQEGLTSEPFIQLLSSTKTVDIVVDLTVHVLYEIDLCIVDSDDIINVLVLKVFDTRGASKKDKQMLGTVIEFEASGIPDNQVNASGFGQATTRKMEELPLSGIKDEQFTFRVSREGLAHDTCVATATLQNNKCICPAAMECLPHPHPVTGCSKPSNRYCGSPPPSTRRSVEETDSEWTTVYLMVYILYICMIATNFLYFVYSAKEFLSSTPQHAKKT